MAGKAGAATLALGLAVTLAACAGPVRVASHNYNVDPAVVAMYAPVETEPFRIPAPPVRKIPPQYFRQLVTTPAHVVAAPGTIVVDPNDKFLYLVQADGTSMRYGIGVGRQGFAWSGEATIASKQEWPKWFPPPEMVARDPKAAPYANGMDGGLENPLGARALYLYQGGKDTLFRLHGTNEPMSIGQAVSSGCVRMLNQDIIDLYGRVPVGTKVVVLNGPATAPMGGGYYPPVAIGPGMTAPGAVPAPTPVTAIPIEPAPII